MNDYRIPPILSAVKGTDLPADAGVHQEEDGTLRLARDGEKTVGRILSAEEAWKLSPPPEGYSYAAIELRACHAAVWHV